MLDFCSFVAPLQTEQYWVRPCLLPSSEPISPLWHAPSESSSLARSITSLLAAIDAKPSLKTTMACHSDHQAPRLTQRSRKPFSHQLLRAAVQEQCESCHKAPADNLHRQITGNCKQCHNPDAWKPATFEHDKLFVLDKDHNAPCVTCHIKNEFSRYTCYGCHEHQPAKIKAEHLEEGIRNFENCVECHCSATEEPLKSHAEALRAEAKKRTEARGWLLDKRVL